MTDGMAENPALASIPSNGYLRLRTQLEPVTLKLGYVLYEPNRLLRHVYFPIDCLSSLLTAVKRCRTLQVGIVGRGGMAGMPSILGLGVSGVRMLVQGGATVWQAAPAPFRAEFHRNRPLRDALYSYTDVSMAQISSTAAFNRLHAAETRVARCLLLTRDRVRSDSVPLTHTFLAHMLGLRREGVTEAASELKRRELIDYSRGNVGILDHSGHKKSS